MLDPLPAPADVLTFPLPPTSGPEPVAPPVTPPAPDAVEAPAPVPPPPAAAPAPAPDDVEALRAKVTEQAHVIELAKTRVETLGAQKLQALEQVQLLEEQLEAARLRETQLRTQIASLEAAPVPTPTSEEQTLADLARRVAALEVRVG